VSGTNPAIEVRHAQLEGGKTEFDEIVVASHGPIESVHLEKMGANQFCLIIETRRERACFFIGAKRAPVDAWESWREAKNNRSDGQKQRWARTPPEQRRRRRRR